MSEILKKNLLQLTHCTPDLIHSHFVGQFPLSTILHSIPDFALNCRSHFVTVKGVWSFMAGVVSLTNYPSSAFSLFYCYTHSNSLNSLRAHMLASTVLFGVLMFEGFY